MYWSTWMTSSSPEVIPKDLKSFIEQVCSNFKCWDLGSLSYFLGIETKKVDGGLAISQRKYSLDLLYRFRMDDCKAVADLPRAIGKRLSNNDGVFLPDPTSY